MSGFCRHIYWIALTDSTDASHERAEKFTEEIVTTDEVLSEYLTFFCAAPEFMRREVALAVNDILQEPSVTVTPQSRESFLAGLKLYRDRPDKGYSLTDRISMATMRREGLTHVLTNDRHFEQEGLGTVQGLEAFYRFLSLSRRSVGAVRGSKATRLRCARLLISALSTKFGASSR